MPGPPLPAPSRPARAALQVRAVATPPLAAPAPARASGSARRGRHAQAVAPTPRSPSFVPPPPVTLDYRWEHGDLALPARLVWAVHGSRYSLSLETVGPGTRAAAWLRSEGTWDVDGLHPGRHTARRPRNSERALTFVRESDATEVAFSTRTTRTPVPADAQDGISWLPHWLGLLQTQGVSRPVTVADTDGQVRGLHLVAPATQALHWLATAEGPRDSTVEVWLSAEPPHWPTRLLIVTPWGGSTQWCRTAPDDGASPLGEAEP